MRAPSQPHFRLLGTTAALAAFLFVLFRVHVPSPAGEPLDPARAAHLFERSRADLLAGKWDKALGPLLELSQSAPENSIYLRDLADIYGHLARHREAAATWEQYLDRSPTPVEACPGIGQAYLKQALPKEAVHAFERCLALDPENADSIFYLAHAYERVNNIVKAEELYRRGARSHPEYQDMFIGLARILLRKGEPAEAGKLASGALKNSPGNTDALFVLGVASRRAGDRISARQYFEQGARLRDNDTDFHLALAEMAEQDKDFRNAIVQYQKVAELDRNNPEATSRLTVLGRLTVPGKVQP